MIKSEGIFYELTEIQLNIRELATEIIQLAAHDQEAVKKLTVIKQLASCGGLLVDECREGIGLDVYNENNIDWLVSPKYRSDGPENNGVRGDG